MPRDYAALPHEYYEEMGALSDAQFGRLTRALLLYSMTGQVTELKGSERHYLLRVIHREDRYRQSYESLTEKRRSAGRKGGLARAGKARQCQAEQGYTDTDTKTKTETSLTEVRRSDRFVPPTPEEVTQFCREAGLAVDPDRWYNHYAANGWRIGCNPMRDWQASVRTWVSQPTIPSGQPKSSADPAGARKAAQQMKRLLEEDEAQEQTDL